MREKNYPDPTAQQAIASWRLVCDLVELGYPHNFQLERSDIRDYMYAASRLVKRAFQIKEVSEDA